MKHVTKKLLCFITALLLGVASAAPCPPESDRFIYPVNGTVSDHIGSCRDGCSRTHDGVDIAAPIGTPVIAAAGGEVIFAGWTSGAGGKIVKIQHPNGTIGFYAHLNTIGVTTGKTVSAGTVIGTVGNTGIGTGPHLHFEIQPPGGGNRRLNVGGQTWDDAAGITVGQSISAGSCINMAAGPGGEVVGNQDGGTGDTGGGSQDVPPEGTYDPGEPPPLSSAPFTGKGIDIEGLLPDPLVWMNATLATLNEYKLPTYLNTLGMVLLFAFFVYSLLSANYFHKSDQYMAIFGRLIIAAGLIWGTPLIANSVKNMWEGIYKNLEKAVVKPAVDDLEEHINNLGPWLVIAASAANAAHLAAAVMPDSFDVEAGVEFIVSIKASADVDAGEELLKMLAQKADEVTRLLFALMCLMGSLYGIYFLAIYTSGMIVILAGILIPVLAAFILLPGSASWFVRWFTMVVLCLVTVTVFPFVFRVVIDQGVNAPIKAVNAVGEDMVKQLNYLKSVTDKKPAAKDWWDIGKWTAYVKDVAEAAVKVAGNFLTLMLRWVFQSIILAISVLASIFLMQQIPGLIAGFIGGSAGSAASATNGAALAGVVGGLAGAGAAGIMRRDGGDKKDNDQKQLPPAGGSRAALPAAGGSSAGGSSSQSSSRGNNSARGRG